MRRIRIERKAQVRDRWDRYAVLPFDPRDPDILRAKSLPPESRSEPRPIGRP